MALTIAEATTGLGVRKKNFGAEEFSLVKITFDSSYPTGGEAVTPSEVGMTRIDGAWPVGQAAGSRVAQWDQANGKILLFDDALAQVANASDQSTIVIYFIFIGV